MARIERVLALDIGASSIKAGEFEYQPNGSITLIGFAIKDYSEELTEANRTTVVANLVREVIQEKGFSSRKILVSLSGQSAFIRFVKLPPVSDEEKRVRQIVEFEARQNVPFPMDEVIWDYQLIAAPEADEMDVMFVVIKNEIVEQITKAIQSIGLDPVLVDIAPVACYNAARANHVGDDECALILNIGARSSNLLFVDRNRFFARTIPIAGTAITQQIAKEFNIGMAEAEELKRRHGFVALGGAYEAPESEVAATVSKIVRSVVTRLHGEVNRSISVYRAQQKGNRPTHLYLAGGSSIMMYTDRFFRETLDIEVGYLNPFQVVTIGPQVDLRALQEAAHLFSEVVGLGLRYRVQCPVEISLIPETIRRQQIFQARKPYLAACAVVVVTAMLLGLLVQQWRVAQYRGVFESNEGIVKKLETIQGEIKREGSQTLDVRKKYDAIVEVIRQRDIIPQLLNRIQELKPADVWLVRLTPIYSDVKEVGAGGSDAGRSEPGGMGGMPAGPMGWFGMGAMPAAPKAATPSAAGRQGSGSFKISGFEIEGHSVFAKEEAAAVKTGGEGAKAAPEEPGKTDATGAAASEKKATEVPVTVAVAPVTPPAEKGAVPPALPPVVTPAVAGEVTPAAASPDAAAAPEKDQGATPAKTDEATRTATGTAPAGTKAPDAEPAAAAADAKAGTSAPELLFLDRLRGCDLFDSDPRVTAISKYAASDSVRNLGSFTMQVKLKTPIEVNR